MRSGTRLHADQARRQLRHQLAELRARDYAAHHYRTARIDAVHRKHILCQVDSNRRNYAHGTSPLEKIDVANQSWHVGAASGRGSPLHSLEDTWKAPTIYWRSTTDPA